MQADFYALFERCQETLRGEEILTGWFQGEGSDFVRFNHGRVRQPGTVDQRELVLRLVNGQRHATSNLTLSGVLEEDVARCIGALGRLRDRIPHLPEDPHLLLARDVMSSEDLGACELPESSDVVEAVHTAATGDGRSDDVVGIYAAGGIYRGFANSLGQRNWFRSYSFSLDWCLYHQADKAVKSTYAGFDWDLPTFERKMGLARRQVAVLARPAKKIRPGKYRVYLAPAALGELVGLVSGWGGFGLKAHKTKTTPLLRLVEDGSRLNSMVSLAEDTARGVAPTFQADGFVKPSRVSLIEEGRLCGHLISPRSAREFGVSPNGAGGDEAPVSLDMASGDLPAERVIETLEDGVWVGNLWYLNFSDRSACRVTGMTRFATFWVEGGEVVAPLSVMRFDETFYSALGENLVRLTDEEDFQISTGTYFRRSTDSARMPGALIENFSLTL